MTHDEMILNLSDVKVRSTLIFELLEDIAQTNHTKYVELMEVLGGMSSDVLTPSRTGTTS